MIIESRVLNLKDFLILDKEPAKKVYGNDYLVQSQLKKILKGKWNKYKNNEEVITLITKMKDWPEKPGQIYKDFYESSKKDVVPYFRGVVYNGKSDAYTCIIYDRNNIEPLRYSLNNGKTWTLINDKNIIKRIKSGKFKTKDLPNVHFKNKVQIGKFSDINLDYIKKLPKNELEFFVDKISKDKQGINIDIYKFLSQDLKQLYIEKRIKAGYELEEYELEDATDSLKELYAKKRIQSRNKFLLNDDEYKVLPDNLKQLYIERLLEEEYQLSKLQYKATPDNLKQLYIEEVIKRFAFNTAIEEYVYRDAPDNLKQFYIEKLVEAGSYLENRHYSNTPNNLKQYYFKLLKNKKRRIPIEYYYYGDDYRQYLKDNP